MALKITSNDAFTHRYILVDSGGVGWRETTVFGGEQRFKFAEILMVLMSEDNVLSFQVGQTVYKIRVNPAKPDHKQLIDVLVQETTRTLPIR